MAMVVEPEAPSGAFGFVFLVVFAIL